ncbi:MAG: DUF1178 family protein [Polaromonas sp.]|nr:MAG: DUF1178 family protein [Polaromonas sp.]
MKVLNLQCSQQHLFEGWFASEDDFQSQLARGLVECPMCCDNNIQKMPSAPRLNLGVHQAGGCGLEGGHQKISESASSSELTRQQSPVAKSTAGATDVTPNHSSAEQAKFFTALRHMVANTEDVGDRFAHEARAMHHGDSQARSIRGVASLREAQELRQEGIDVLPLPPQLKETLQ